MKIILFIFVAQLSTILHELGHAVVALIISKKDVFIIIGRTQIDSIRKVISIGRLKIKIGRFSPVTGFAYVDESDLNRAQLVIFYLGGPLISLLLTLVLFFTSRQISNAEVQEILQFSTVYLFIQFLVTVLPIRYPRIWGAYGNYDSDGLSVVKLFKKQDKEDNTH
ncbi:MAG: hypothetical protein ACOX7B_12950 [Christensenellales bacterium]|jgi:hypothetical protein